MRGKRKMMNEKEDQKNGDKRTETTMIISQKKTKEIKTKGSKQRDQNKESKKLRKDTHLKEDDSEKTMFTKSM